MRVKADVQTRFWKHVDKQEHCWLWTGGVFRGGYGQFANSDGSKYAHRASYEFLVGDVPEGMQLHHTCYQRNCVNPAHLVPMIPHEHIRIHKPLGGTGYHKTHCKRGHELAGANVYENPVHHKRQCKTCQRVRYQEKILALK